MSQNISISRVAHCDEEGGDAENGRATVGESREQERAKDVEEPETPTKHLKVEEQKADDPNENSYARQMERIRNL